MLTTMLRSIKELYGCNVHAGGGVIGSARDFYLDKDTWAIKFVGVTLSDDPGHELWLPAERLEGSDNEGRTLLFGEPMRLEAPHRTDAEDFESSRRILGFKLHAQDAFIGRVEDLVVSEAGWTVRYLVAVDEMGSEFLVSPWWIKRVSWQRGEVVLRYKTSKVPRSAGDDFETHDNKPVWA